MTGSWALHLLGLHQVELHALPVLGDGLLRDGDPDRSTGVFFLQAGQYRRTSCPAFPRRAWVLGPAAARAARTPGPTARIGLGVRHGRLHLVVAFARSNVASASTPRSHAPPRHSPSGSPASPPAPAGRGSQANKSARSTSRAGRRLRAGRLRMHCQSSRCPVPGNGGQQPCEAHLRLAAVPGRKMRVLGVGVRSSACCTWLILGPQATSSVDCSVHLAGEPTEGLFVQDRAARALVRCTRMARCWNMWNGAATLPLPDWPRPGRAGPLDCSLPRAAPRSSGAAQGPLPSVTQQRTPAGTLRRLNWRSCVKRWKVERRSTLGNHAAMGVEIVGAQPQGWQHVPGASVAPQAACRCRAGRRSR